MRIGPYEIVEELGRGGMGVVYRARAESPPREVALKLVAERTSDRQRQRFEQEARSLGRLQHPGIVAIHDVGVHEGQPYFAMEYVKGRSLEGLLADQGPLAPARALELFSQLTRALAHAHDRGVLHRDLKPANILLSEDGQPYLTDFGLARDLTSSSKRLTLEGAPLGTPGYWSPEQALGDQDAIDARTDVYGLGASLYAALVGEAPLIADSFAECVVAVRERVPTPPRTLRPEVDAALDAVVMRCLAKDPDARYASAEDLAWALEALEHGAAPRSRAPAIGLLGLVGVGALGLALWASSGDTPEPRTAPRPDPALADSNPDLGPPPLSPADACVERGAAHLENTDSAAARQEFEEALRLDPGHPRALLGMGEVCLLERDYSTAVRWITNGLAQREDAQGYSSRGFAHMALKSRDAALADFERALAIDPKHVLTHFNLGVLYAQTKQLEKAEHHFGRTIAYSEGDFQADARVNRACLFLSQRDYDRAELDLHEALRLVPEHAEAHFNLGLCHEERERWYEAAQAFHAALDLLPPDTPRRASAKHHLLEAWDHATPTARGEGGTEEERELFALGLSTLSSDPVRAEEAYRKLAELRPNDPFVFNQWGQALAILGDHAAGLERFTRSYALERSPICRYNMAVSQLELGDVQGAAKNAEAYVELMELDPDGYVLRGRVLHALGDLPGARRALEQAIELEPNSERSARLRRQLGLPPR